MLSLLPLLSAALLSNASPVSDAANVGWQFIQKGHSGILALESIIVSPTLAIFFNRAANDPLQINNHSAWGALWNLETSTPTPLDLTTNTFCASGAFLSNGSMVSTGGTPVEFPQDGDQDGTSSIRIFEPCDDPAGVGCTIFDDPTVLHLAKPRWYATALKIFDGSIMVIGGIRVPTPFYNDPVNQTSSFEFFPKKDGGAVRPSPFLERTLPANLFPRAFQLPDGNIFMVANNQSILYNIETGIETPGPEIPNGVRVTNPFDGTAAMLPLSPPDFVPEVLVCGGTNISDATPPLEISAETPASSQCSRIKLTPEGIAAGWQVEHMLEPRIMPEMILMPNGQVLIINGGRTGAAALGSVGVLQGNSNADNAVFTPELYTPNAPLGQRISREGLPTTTIARMYHSSVTLTGNGNILLAGSNPNPNSTTFDVKFPTEFRVETLNPPFMFVPRPAMANVPAQIGFGKQVTIPVTIPANLKASSIQVSLMDLGFSTHAWHSSARLVFMESSLSRDRKSLTFTTPPNGKVFPPGPAWVFLTVDDVTGVGARIMLGSGITPPTLE